MPQPLNLYFAPTILVGVLPFEWEYRLIVIIVTNYGVDVPKDLGNKVLSASEGVLANINLFEKDKAGKSYLGATDIIAFSETCQAARRISSDVRKKHALKSLLTAVVCGDEDLARKIVTSRPELLLDSSAIVTDLSGKEIKELTPLQAAICAGDVEMVQMIVDVLQQKLQPSIPLSFTPELEMQRQFEIIYPNGDINAVEISQKVKAQEFKDSMLNNIFAAINRATVAEVEFELDTPGIINADSQLNTALHKFRDKFTTTSNLEQIFNPFYLLKAFEFYDEQFNNFHGNENDQWDKRNLFWCQIIGYTQRHLPACYLQAFAQGIYYIVNNGEKLERDFEFRHHKGFFMRAVVGDLKNLGYKYGGPACPVVGEAGPVGGEARPVGGGIWLAMATLSDSVGTFQKLLQTKKSGLENLFTRRVAGILTCRTGA